MAAPEDLREQSRQREHAGERALEDDVEVEREEGAPEPQELDPETRARRDAALRQELKRMGELMHDALGVGLAATQLGVLHRALVFRTDPEEPVTALVNPVLEWTSDELEIAEEGCLSLPGVHVEVERPAAVRVRGRDGAG